LIKEVKMRTYNPITTALTPDSVSKLKKIAERERRSLTNLMRIILEDYIEKQERKKVTYRQKGNKKKIEYT